MQAIIMAGGAGSRLRPLTNDVPKPMVKIIDKPALTYIIALLKKYGYTDIGVTLNYMPEVIMAYYRDGAEYGVKLRYFIEETPLGTAGGVKQAAEFLDGDFLVMSGDAYSEINLDEMYAAHKRKKLMATMAVKKVKNAGGFGVVKYENGVVTDFVEKPAVTTETTVNTGIYMLKRDVLELIPDGFYDFGRDLFPKLIGQTAVYKTRDYWSDIGTLERYYETNLYVVKRATES